MDIMEIGASDELVQKWEAVLEGIDEDYTRRVTAQLLDNQLKAIQQSRVDEAAVATGTTTVGQLGTFQKFSFPLVRRVYPELLANKLVGVQPMSGPVSQIFYLGNDRAYGTTVQNIYSKYNLTYRGFETSGFSNASSIDLDTATGVTTLNTSNLASVGGGVSPSSTFGGQIANWPAGQSYGWSVSAGERLTGTGIPEITFHIEQQPVVARTKKMRALWTLEASQDLRAYHNLDLERELTDLLGKEIKLEVDRELIEDLRGIAYDIDKDLVSWGGFRYDALDQQFNSNDMGFQPSADSSFDQFQYDQQNGTGGDFIGSVNQGLAVHRNIWLVDFTSSSLPFAPQHAGHVYSNLLAAVNFASQDIYKTTHRGPGNWLLCAPIVASMLESAAKLEGGVARTDGPTNLTRNSIAYVGKVFGRYDLYVDPLYPEGEILMGYKGDSPMDAGFVYSPYIPFQALPTITDPESFQPRKGILTRYGKSAVAPASRFFRVIRIVGPNNRYLYEPFSRNQAHDQPAS